ncbi:MAG: hypothetical protein ACI4J1_11365 [Ruminiclostridium sp.]
MKFKKIAAVLASIALSASMLSVTAFADVDYMAEAEANKGLTFMGSAGWAGGQWIVGNDSKPMETPLTIADLEAADHFEISYTATEVPPSLDENECAQLTFCYKFTTAVDEDGKSTSMEAYLPEGWYQYGPTGEDGNSYHVIEIFAWDVKESDTLIIPTSAILDSIADKDAIMYMAQFGIGCNTYDYDDEWVDEADMGADYEVTITSVKLCDEPDEASEAAMSNTDDTAEETTAEETTAEPEETTTSETTEAPAETSAPEADTSASTTDAASTAEQPYDGFPIWGYIAIGAGVLLVAVVIIVTVAKKKK